MNELIIKEWLSDFIENHLLKDIRLRYTKIYFTENSGYLYLKIEDKLRPHFYIAEHQYFFNTFIALRENSNNIYSLPSKHELFKYLIYKLDNSILYLNYLGRLDR